MSQSYLVFTLNGKRFAIDVLVVKEIVWLPELTFEEEDPAFIAGAFNLRGKIVHVMDLNLRLRHQPQRYSLSDKVVVLDLEGRSLGVIVNDLLDVTSISPDDIEEAPEHRFIAGEAKLGEEIVMVIDHISISEFGTWNSELKSAICNPQSTLGYFSPSATPEEKAIFHERTLNLMKEAAPEVEGLVPLAVFSLNGEYYGANLEAIREFSDIRSVTPVPCTPPHIVGDMNLRGDILTLVDIRGLLNIPLKREAVGQKAIVARINELLAGIPV